MQETFILTMEGKMKARYLKVILIITAFFFAALSATNSMAASTIKIGVIAPFKTSSGESLLNAAKMAAEDINAQGGIMGKKIELVLGNTEYKPEKGAMAYKKLVLQDKCEVVFGTCSSGVAKSVMDQMARYKKLFISTGAASEALAKQYDSNRKKYKYWFRVMHQSGDLSLAIHDFIYNLPVKKMGAKRMAIMAENALWTRGMVKAAEKFFKDHGLEIVYSEFFDVETKDFTPIFTKIIDRKADFIYEISAHVDGAIYIKQWYDLKGPMIGGVSGTGASSRYWRDCGGKAVGETLIAMGSFRVALTPKSIAFYDRYVAKFKETPGYPSGYTYDAFHIYKAAVEKAGTTDSEALVPILEKTDYVGVAGRWVFTDLHNAKYGPGYRQLPMVQWRKDGSRKVVWPKSMATGEFLPPPWKQ
ncbi:MAG: ABC transporter substrate-binding protein [Deltaproteobacteria bacterium]|nr:ABC transporter substrate-binding protein [Deltaproteobacteria bacterium]MBW2126939.1 ABC transporter substrate-binding protein [Deltaproteobacteria bacterium]